jgi:hypothetical protein
MNELTHEEMMEYAGGYPPGAYLACIAGLAGLLFGIIDGSGMIMNLSSSLIYRFCAD